MIIKLIFLGKSTNDWIIIKRASELSLKYSLIFTGCAFIAATCYIATPIINDCISYFILNVQPSYEMPFKSAFLYDIKESPAYELTYLLIVYWTYMLIGINVRILIPVLIKTNFKLSLHFRLWQIHSS